MQATSIELAKIDIFSKLESTFLTKLASNSQVQSYQRGEILIHEEEMLLPKLYAVLEGKLLAQKISLAGKETILRQLLPGEIFAAPALFGDRVAPATVVALQDTKIVTIAKTTLLETIQTEPEVALEILGCFNQRLQQMHQTIHGLISERAIVRLVRLIIYTAKHYGFKKTESGICLNQQLSYHQMSRTIGITYEECVRLMKKNLDSVVIYRRGGNITLENLAALENFLRNLND